MKKLLTDRQILRKIYDKYYQNFCEHDKSNPSRESKIYVPIDCEVIANEFSVDPDIIFGRLYYHLDKKYGYTQDDGSRVHLFAMQVGADCQSANFPLLSAVLAELETARIQFTLPIAVSVVALIVSILSVLYR